MVIKQNLNDIDSTKVLIDINSLVLPIVTREVTIHLEPGASANSTLDLSNLGFLLGTFPSAPGTLFYAMQYNVAVDMVSRFLS